MRCSWLFGLLRIDGHEPIGFVVIFVCEKEIARDLRV